MSGPEQRQQELRASLEAQLERAAAEGSLDARGRLRWLSVQLENYLERWLAFQEASGRRELQPSDGLFLMLSVGVERLEAERAAQAEPCNWPSWAEFRQALAAQDRPASEPCELRRLWAAARRDLAR